MLRAARAAGFVDEGDAARLHAASAGERVDIAVLSLLPGDLAG